MNEVAGTDDSPCPSDGDKIVGAFIIGCQKSAAEDPKILLIISPDDQVCLAWEEGAFPEQQPQSSDSYAEDVQRRALQAREAQEREALRQTRAAEHLRDVIGLRRRVVLPFVGLDLLYWLLAIIINATHTAVPRVPQTTVGQINAMVWIDIRDVTLPLVVGVVVADILGLLGAMQRHHVVFSVFLALQVITTVVVSLQGLSLFVLWRFVQIVAGLWLRSALIDYQVLNGSAAAPEPNSMSWVWNNALSILQGFCCLLLGCEPGRQQTVADSAGQHRHEADSRAPSGAYTVAMVPMTGFQRNMYGAYAPMPTVPGWQAPVFLPMATLMPVTNTLSQGSVSAPGVQGGGGGQQTTPSVRHMIASMLTRPGTRAHQPRRAYGSGDGREHIVSMPIAGEGFAGALAHPGRSHTADLALVSLHTNPHYTATAQQQQYQQRQLESGNLLAMPPWQASQGGAMLAPGPNGSPHMVDSIAFNPMFRTGNTGRASVSASQLMIAGNSDGMWPGTHPAPQWRSQWSEQGARQDTSSPAQTCLTGSGLSAAAHAPGLQGVSVLSCHLFHSTLLTAMQERSQLPNTNRTAVRDQQQSTSNVAATASDQHGREGLISGDHKIIAVRPAANLNSHPLATGESCSSGDSQSRRPLAEIISSPESGCSPVVITQSDAPPFGASAEQAARSGLGKIRQGNASLSGQSDADDVGTLLTSVASLLVGGQPTLAVVDNLSNVSPNGPSRTDQDSNNESDFAGSQFGFADEERLPTPARLGYARLEHPHPEAPAQLLATKRAMGSGLESPPDSVRINQKLRLAGIEAKALQHMLDQRTGTGAQHRSHPSATCSAAGHLFADHTQQSTSAGASQHAHRQAEFHHPLPSSAASSSMHVATQAQQDLSAATAAAQLLLEQLTRRKDNRS